MAIYNFPDQLIPDFTDVFVHRYQISVHANKNKVNLSQNVFSFLIQGQKEVHFQDTTVDIGDDKILLMAAGNCLMTENLSEYESYESLLLFFSQETIERFLFKYKPECLKLQSIPQTPYFIVEKDEFIKIFIQSLAQSLKFQNTTSSIFLEIKFDEIALYLCQKHGQAFELFLYSLLQNRFDLSFKKIIDTYKYSILDLEEIAFLCNMSLSTFKRHFQKNYHEVPGKWFQKQRLQQAKDLIQSQSVRPSEIYMNYGYENLSNFSNAFKNEFGYRPSQTT